MKENLCVNMNGCNMSEILYSLILILENMSLFNILYELLNNIIIKFYLSV